MKSTYQIDPAHSGAHFSVRHMMISNVRGSFGSVTGTVAYDPDNPSATAIQASIDASTLSTGDEKRDTHVKSADFLHVEQHPHLTFQSTAVESARAGELKVLGDLTIHGVTKPVELVVEGPTSEGKDPWGNLRVGASATAKINRSDFGLTFNAPLELGGVVIGDELKIELDVSLIKQQAAAA